MLVFGSTFNPIYLIRWMKLSKIRYSLNKPAILCNNIVFSSVFNLGMKKHKVGNRRIIVFDSLERLNTVEGIKIISRENEEYLKNFLLNNKDRGPDEKIVIKRVDPIADTIEQNKQVGLLHKYNTILYSISTKDLREEMRQIVLNYVSGKFDFKQLKDHIDGLLKVRRSKTRETVLTIFNIISSDEFGRIRTAVMALLRHSSPVDRSTVERLSSLYKIEPYDVHYLYSVITKPKKNTKT